MTLVATNTAPNMKKTGLILVFCIVAWVIYGEEVLIAETSTGAAGGSTDSTINVMKETKIVSGSTASVIKKETTVSAEVMKKLIQQYKGKVIYTALKQEGTIGSLEERLARYNNWLENSGLDDHRISIKLVEGKRVGVIAREHIPPNTTLFEMPWEATIKVSFIREMPEFAAILHGNMSVSNNHLLALYLMVETTKPESRWKPWLEMLDYELDAVSLWDYEELIELQNSGVLFQTSVHLDTTHKLYAYLRPKVLASGLLKAEQFTYEGFLLFASLISSRAWGQVNPGSSFLAAPYADMWNHKYDSSKAHFTATSFSIKTVQDYEAGEEVFLDYGFHSNQQFVMTYGFIEEENYPTMSHPLFVDAEQLSLYNITQPFLSSLGYSTGAFFITLKEWTLDSVTMSILRLMNMNKDDVKAEAMEGIFLTKGLTPGISLLNELNSIRSIAYATRSIRELYRTTLEEDEKIVSSKEFATFSYRKQLAIRLRLSEKKLLKKQTDLITEYWRLIFEEGRYGESAVPVHNINIKKQKEAPPAEVIDLSF